MSPGHALTTQVWWRWLLALYVDGFREMRVGRTLWVLILLKLTVLAVLGLTLFPNRLQRHYDNDAARAAHVLQALETGRDPGPPVAPVPPNGATP